MNRTENESAEDVARRATINLALLIRFVEAEGRSERGGTSPELDADAWYAIEQILITTRNDVKRLESLLEAADELARLAAKGAAR